MRSLTKGRRGFTKDFIVANIARMEFQPIFLPFIELKLTAWLHSPPLQAMCNPEMLMCCGHCEAAHCSY